VSFVDFRFEVVADGPGTSTPGEDKWVFNPANDDLAGLPLLMTAEIYCRRGYAKFAHGAIYELRIQTPLIPPQENRPPPVTFHFVVKEMQEEEGWNRFKVHLEGRVENLFDPSRIVLWFSDELEPPADLQDKETYNIEEITPVHSPADAALQDGGGPRGFVLGD
jgi:hypothetical protein